MLLLSSAAFSLVEPGMTAQTSLSVYPLVAALINSTPIFALLAVISIWWCGIFFYCNTQAKKIWHLQQHIFPSSSLLSSSITSTIIPGITWTHQRHVPFQFPFLSMINWEDYHHARSKSWVKMVAWPGQSDSYFDYSGQWKAVSSWCHSWRQSSVFWLLTQTLPLTSLISSAFMASSSAGCCLHYWASVLPQAQPWHIQPHPHQPGQFSHCRLADQRSAIIQFLHGHGYPIRTWGMYTWSMRVTCSFVLWTGIIFLMISCTFWTTQLSCTVNVILNGTHQVPGDPGLSSRSCMLWTLCCCTCCTTYVDPAAHWCDAQYHMYTHSFWNVSKTNISIEVWCS